MYTHTIRFWMTRLFLAIAIIYSSGPIMAQSEFQAVDFRVVTPRFATHSLRVHVRWTEVKKSTHYDVVYSARATCEDLRRDPDSFLDHFSHNVDVRGTRAIMTLPNPGKWNVCVTAFNGVKELGRTQTTFVAVNRSSPRF